MNCPNCRAALPPGSRFCNRCGVTLTPAQPAPQERTQAYNPGTGQFGQPTQYAQPAPGYVPPAVPAEPARKPVWLLALILALVAGGVTAGTLFLVKGKHSAVVSNENPLVPTGSGVTQTGQPGQPAGPAVVSSQPGKPAPEGAPVTSAPGKPASDMAPSVMMTDPGKPGSAPSVVQAPTGPATPGMPVQAAPAQPRSKGAPIMAAPRTAVPSGAPVGSAPPPQLPPTASAVDRYLAWLQYAESERSKLSEQANMMQQQEYASFMDLLFKQASGDVSADDDRRMMQLPQEQLRKFYRVAEVQSMYWQSWLRSKPPVPEDCKWLDKYYTDAGLIAVDTAAQLKLALARNNLGAIQTAARRQGLIDQNLRKAQQELAKVRDVRRLPIHWDIEVGGGGGISGFPSIPGLGM